MSHNTNYTHTQVGTRQHNSQIFGNLLKGSGDASCDGHMTTHCCRGRWEKVCGGVCGRRELRVAGSNSGEGGGSHTHLWLCQTCSMASRLLATSVAEGERERDLWRRILWIKATSLKGTLGSSPYWYNSVLYYLQMNKDAFKKGHFQGVPYLEVSLNSWSW